MSARPRAAGIASPDARAARFQGLALLVFTGCTWGFNWPVNKFLLSELPPFTMRAVSVGLGVVFAFLIAIVLRERLTPPRGQWGRLIMLGLLNYGAFTVLTTIALVWLDASVAVLITYTLPVWATLLAWPVLGERPKLRGVIALIIALAGVALLVGADPGKAATAGLPGVICAFLAAMAFALGTVLSKRRPVLMPPVAGVAWQALFGLVPPLVLVFLLDEHPHFAALTPLAWVSIAYVAIFPMTLSYLTWFRALHLLPAALASTGVLIAPLVGVLASAALLGDPLGPRQVVAMVVVLGGVALAARG